MTRVEKIILKHYSSNGCNIKLTAQYLNETTDITFDEYWELRGSDSMEKVKIIINNFTKI